MIRKSGKRALLSATMIGGSFIPSLVAAQTAPTAPVATSTPAPVQASSPAPNPDRPIQPRAGNIRTFSGGLSGTAGNIRTFNGDLEADAGNIRTFAGNIRTFGSDIRAFQALTYPAAGTDPNFWGTIKPLGGSLAPSAGNIRTFAGEFEALAGNIRTFAGNIRTFQSDPVSANAMLGQIALLTSTSRATWGSAVQQATGKSFDDVLTNPLLAKYGIDLNDPASLSTLNEATVELFLLDWNDNVMNYSGVNQTDHWMKAVNWSPALTQQLIGGGVNAKIGILDFTIGGDAAANVVTATGISKVDGGHGTAVASLIVSPFDGRGVMGIAPTASIVSYNPFDATMTAGWADIRKGLTLFADSKVSVVNMSLGVPGWTLSDGWNTVFTEGKLYEAAKGQLFVLAAGNDGVVQPKNIEWAVDHNPVIIVVGSVDPNGLISAFSNTPGTTCLLKDGKCDPTKNLLMTRFMVAPGEFILVDDGNGGVTRMSGTSFAAPLVSGTAALIADRWPWLVGRPKDIADIILNSATDLGAPGTDAVYGRGMLNVGAALSPRDFNSLKWVVSVGGVVKTYDAKNMATLALTSKSTWEAAGAFVSVIDPINSSYRDFVIPLSSKLIGQTVGTSQEQFNAYLQSRFWSWAQGMTSTAPTGFAAFTDQGATSPMLNFGTLHAQLTMKPRAYRAGLRQDPSSVESALALQTPDGRIGFAVGNGAGAPTLVGVSGFAMQSDFDLQSGGANPFLGLASGSGFGAVRYRFGDRVTASVGVTHRNAVRNRISDPLGALAVDGYQASAYNLTVAYKAKSWLSANLGYTMLDEQSALLGTQSADFSDFRGGSQTDAATIGLELTPSSGLAFAAAATVGRTRQGDATRQNLSAGRGGIISTAFQASIAKTALLSADDSLRFSLSQPLHMESGSLDFTSVAVVDRSTGELGVVTQRIALNAPPRSHTAEAIYRLPLMDGNASFTVFGKYRMGQGQQGAAESRATGGLGFSVRY